MGDPGGSPPIALDYSTAPPRWRRRIRLIVILLLIGAASLAAWRWGPATWKGVQLLYVQRQCLTYSPSPDLVVYEGNAELAKSLLTLPEYVAPEFMRITGIDPVGRFAVDPSIAVHRTKLWDQFLGRAGITYPQAFQNRPAMAAICFLGELQTPSDQRRLVMVECYPTRHGQNGPDTGSIGGISIAPAPPFSALGPVIRSDITWFLGKPFGMEPSNLRIFSGQRDPKNRSRFMIRYQVYGQEGVVDGSVDDAGVVNLMPLPPIPQPSSRRSGYPYR